MNWFSVQFSSVPFNDIVGPNKGHDENEPSDPEIERLITLLDTCRKSKVSNLITKYNNPNSHALLASSS